MSNNQAIENIKSQLFSFEGKIDRLKFIIQALPLAAFIVTFIYFRIDRSSFDFRYHFLPNMIMVLVVFWLSLSYAVSLAGKRLNDIGLPCSLAFIIPISPIAFSAFRIRRYIEDGYYDPNFDEIIAYVFFGSAFLTAILLFFLCVVKGIQKKDDSQA